MNSGISTIVPHSIWQVKVFMSFTTGLMIVHGIPLEELSEEQSTQVHKTKN